MGGELSSYPVKEASYILTSILATVFAQQPPKKGKGIERLIQIITLVPTTKENNYRTARLN